MPLCHDSADSVWRTGDVLIHELGVDSAVAVVAAVALEDLGDESLLGGRL